MFVTITQYLHPERSHKDHQPSHLIRNSLFKALVQMVGCEYLNEIIENMKAQRDGIYKYVLDLFGHQDIS